MKILPLLYAALLAYIRLVECGGLNKISEEDAAIYLQNLDTRFSAVCSNEKLAKWKYVTNITTQTEADSIAATKAFVEFQASVQNEVLTNFSDWESINDNRIRREFQFLSLLGPGNMPKEEIDAMNAIKMKLDTAMSAIRICEYDNPENCDIGLSGLDEKLSTIEDFDILQYYYEAWHDAVSSQLNVSDYKAYINYQNILAQHNGLSDISDIWLASFNTGLDGWTSTNFKDLAKSLWTEIQPYYNILHAFLRMKLRENPLYTDRIEPEGPIPANLAKGWTLSKNDLLSIYSSTKPFPNASSLMEAGTDALIKSGYTVDSIFHASDDFYASLGLERMTNLFWENTMMEHPNDGREVNCNPPFEYDMCHGKGSQDFRIKVCGEVNMDYFSIIHHEMGHMEYFMEYTEEDYIFRDGLHPGMHEAVGNSFPLSVTTPKHLECQLGLDLEGFSTDCESETGNATPSDEEINYLYYMALEKLPFLAHTIAMEQWRWEVFENTLIESEYNNRWWELKRMYQGIIPPTPRDSTRFDAATKVITTPNYIRYYISYILQFQLYEAMCAIAENKENFLHNCDFTGSTAVGFKLKNLLKVGFSEPWPETLNEFMGTNEMKAESLIRFFTPLFEHLAQELERAGQKPGFENKW